MKTLLVWCLGLFMTLSPQYVSAQQTHTNHQLGLRVGGGIAMDRRHTAPTLGVGIIGEHALLNHHLEIEWAGILERHDANLDMMESLALKVPWHLTPTMDLFFGLGLMARQHSQGSRWSGGTVLLAGTTYWRHQWGISFEMEYIEDVIRRTHDIEGLVAMMYRFGH